MESHPLRKKKKRPVHFLDLPAECRNRIYEFTLYHSENCGIITYCETHLRHEADQIVHWQGRMYRGLHIEGRAMAAVWGPGPELYEDLLEELDISDDQNQRIVRLLDGSTVQHPNFQPSLVVTTHMCSKSCLAQPPMTQVNRQIRKESVPFFYNVNEFNFELTRFSLDLVRIPIQWFREIGDVNLQHITCFGFKLKNCFRWQNQGLTHLRPHGLEYRRDRLTKSTLGGCVYLAVEHQGRVKSADLKYWHSMQYHQPADIGPDMVTLIEDVVDEGYRMERGGLHIHALLTLILALDPEHIAHREQYLAIGRPREEGPGIAGLVASLRSMWM